MHCLHCGVLLRYDGAIRSDRQLRCWELLGCISIRLLALPRRYLFFDSIFISVFFLWFRNDFKRWSVSVHDKLGLVLRGDILLQRVFDMHELSCGILCREHWIYQLYCMFGGVLLRHFGAVRSEWELRRGKVFSCICVRLHFLS